MEECVKRCKEVAASIIQDLYGAITRIEGEALPIVQQQILREVQRLGDADAHGMDQHL